MTDAEDRSDDQQQAVEACQHTLDTHETGGFSRAQTLLGEARAAVERVQHDESGKPTARPPTIAMSD